jgi:hypothetical protein
MGCCLLREERLKHQHAAEQTACNCMPLLLLLQVTVLHRFKRLTAGFSITGVSTWWLLLLLLLLLPAGMTSMFLRL